MLQEDYWLNLKYYISGLILLIEIASEDEMSKTGVINNWFNGENVPREDEIYVEVYKKAELGIQENRLAETVIREMINTIPQKERYAFDSMGFTFLNEIMDKNIERKYSENEQKHKYKRVYEGLLPGKEYIGLMFADLSYRHSPSIETANVEAYCEKIGMIAWGKLLSELSDSDIAILASDMSRGGRLFLLAGLPDDRAYKIIRKTILLEKAPQDSMDSAAKKLLNDITRHCYHLQK